MIGMLSRKSLYLGHPLLSYPLFLGINILIHILVLSFISFFHLLLGHPMSAIEDWFYRNGWEILIIGKLSSLYLTVKFRFPGRGKKELVKEFLGLSEKLGPRVFVVILLFFGVFLLGEKTFVLKNFAYWEFQFIAFFGHCVLYGPDFVLLTYVTTQAGQLSGKKRLFSILIGALLFTLASQFLIPYQEDLVLWYFCHMIFALVLVAYFNQTWHSVSFYLIGFVAFLGSISNLNPLWGDEYSIINFHSAESVFSLLPYQFIALIYFYWSSHERP